MIDTNIQKKIIMDKPSGIQRTLQKLVFFMGNTSSKKTKKGVIAPISLINKKGSNDL